MAFHGYLKQSTAANIALGPFVDKTDGVTYEVGMAAAMDNATTGIRLSKNGAALADRSSATAPVYDAFGYYTVNLGTGDTDTIGRLKVTFGDAAVCLPCEADFQVLQANIFDSLIAGPSADYLDVSVVQVQGTVVAAGSIPNAVAGAAGGLMIAGSNAATTLASLSVTGQLDAGNVLVDGTTALTGAVTTGAVTKASEAITGALTTGSISNAGTTTLTGIINAPAANTIAGTLATVTTVGTVSAFANDSITAAAIAAGAIDNGAFADDAISAAKIATDALAADGLAADAIAEIVAAVKATVVEAQGSYTLQQVLSIMLAALAGVTSNNGATLSSPNGVATRIAATIDSNNNRTAMTLTPSA